jgi:putative DNA primase/helicase
VGSIAFSAVARVVLATVKPADKHEPRRLVRAKSNLGPDTGGVEYQLISAPVPGHELTAQRVDWGKALEGSARELMAVEQPDAAAGAAADSEAFLLDTLKDGPVATKDIREAAAAHGHKPRTLDRAKKSLGVVAFKAKGALVGVWMWRLPTPNYANGCPEVRQRD